MERVRVRKRTGLSAVEVAQALGYGDQLLIGLSVLKAPEMMGKQLAPKLGEITAEKLRLLGYTWDGEAFRKQVSGVEITVTPGEKVLVTWPSGALRVSREGVRSVIGKPPSLEILDVMRSELDSLM